MKNLTRISAVALAWLAPLSVAWADRTSGIPGKPDRYNLDVQVPEINVSTALEAAAVLLLVVLVAREMFARRRRS